MQRRIIHAACAVLALLIASNSSVRAQCALPYQLTNGQPADATQVMANYNALLTCLNNAAPTGSTNALQYNAGSGAFGAVGPLTPLAVQAACTVPCSPAGPPPRARDC
ncbi:hypothetical protein [Bradyrhizobium neotropicale]|uniref:Uncharacterized protein n=1 Tax=Bradyrhizobium neotropicale TaxID=1497615 RepID=A0A176YTZ2_9BRAD|nr:hypothetical protein [Bradyrhizobium neotropicale]OAF10261.1 hypothetical protein AXW67_25920 [Bradyrhizobium neotropicale]